VRIIIFIIALTLAVLPFAGCSQKQNKTGYGAVRGTIVDDRGAPVAGATVFVDKGVTGLSSDGEGQFYLADISTGSRNIRVESFGHQTWVGRVEVRDTEITDNFKVNLRTLILNFSAFYQEPSALVLTWETPVSGETILEYGKVSGEYTRKLRDNTVRKAHTAVMAGIDTTQIYYFRIKATETEWTEEQQISVASLDIPTAVVLNPPSTIGATSVTLTWSQNSDEDFASYQLYRSSSPTVIPGDGSASLVATSRSRIESYFLDQSLMPGQRYYFRVFVQDAQGYLSGSNTVFLETYSEPNMAPVGVVLNPPQSVTHNGMVLSWTESMDADFYAYRIYVSTLAGVNDKSTLLTTIGARNTLVFPVTGLEPDRSYSFRIYVVDRGGLTAGSNEVLARTLMAANTAPVPVNLTEALSTGPTSVRVSWTRSGEVDFNSYRIYHSRVPGVSEGSVLYSEITNQDSTSIIIQGLLDNTQYYFRVFVVDQSDLKAGSQELGAITSNTFPPAADLTALSPVSSSSVTLVWNSVNISDFGSYRVMRSTASGVTETSTMVANILAMDQTTFIDFAVTQGTTYYYRIFTVDSAGLSTGGTELYVTAMNSAAMAGAILTDTLWTRSNSPVTVIGDLTVNSGATLTIEHGVSVLFNAGSDALSAGRDAARTELIVAGNLKVAGQAGSAVSFNSAAAVKNVGDWGGIWIQSGSPATSIKGFEISNANTYGIALEAQCELENGTIFLNLQNGIQVDIGARPTINLCRITRNSVGIFSQGSADPVVSNSNIVMNNSYGVSGGGVLGLTAPAGMTPGTGGNYIAGNNGLSPTLADLTGLTTQKGTADATMDTSSDTSPEQILNVDTILSAQTGEVSGAGAL
jgi:fibronectin type 3 domain-containing protein